MLTPRQKGCLFSIQSLTSGNEEEGRLDVHARRQKIEDACLAFWIAMFDHELKANEYESGIISGLAVIGLDANKGGWVEAQNFTSVLSAIVTIARALVAYQAHIIRQREMHRLRRQGLEAHESNARAPSTFELVKKMVHRFMTLTMYGGVPTPMDRVLHMRTYGFSIRYGTNGEGRVAWDGDKILIEKQTFTLVDLQSMVKGLYETVRLQLLQELLLLDVDE